MVKGGYLLTSSGFTRGGITKQSREKNISIGLGHVLLSDIPYLTEGCTLMAHDDVKLLFKTSAHKPGQHYSTVLPTGGTCREYWLTPCTILPCAFSFKGTSTPASCTRAAQSQAWKLLANTERG